MTAVTTLVRALTKDFEARGFQRAGNSFYRHRDNFWDVINWQQSKDRIPVGTKFTVNIGLNDTRLQVKLGQASDERPDIWDCHYRIRLGRLLPERDDRWWEIHESRESASLVVEFQRYILDYIDPFLLSFASPDALERIWRSGESPGQTEVVRLRYLKALSG